MAGLLNVAAPCLVWSGVTLATSIEARVKFTAKSLTKPVAFDVGRVVFAAMEKVEMVFATAAVGLGAWKGGRTTGALIGVAATSLLLQSFIVRPKLAERAQMAIDGKELPKSNLHKFYVGLQVLKFVAVLAAANESL